ncbi:MAG: TIGR03936 family radical SAM-associated protein [Planctomycetia bacterium]|nr:TIGR03936 family radical SAM-associated protein [Planctomycetia bacterium]
MFRIRIRFRKDGDLRFLGHRDLMESFFRLLRRAEVKPAYSQGFHPKPKVSFPTALPLGVIGENEVLEIEMPEATDAELLRAKLQAHTLPHWDFLQAEAVPEGEKKARVKSFAYAFAIPLERREAVRGKIVEVLAQTSIPFQRVGREKTVDICKSLLSLALDGDGALRFTLRGDLNDGCGPRDILALLDIADLETCGSVLVRKNVYLF